MNWKRVKYVVAMYLVVCHVRCDGSRLRRQAAGQNECTIRSEGSNKGSFSSPGYPDRDYPRSSHCELDIQAPSGHYIKIAFDDFDLGPKDNCPNDWVTVTEDLGHNEENSVVFCGNSRSAVRIFESKTDRVKMVFQSDDFYTYRGFHAKYHYHRTDSLEGYDNQGIQGRRGNRNNTQPQRERPQQSRPNNNNNGGQSSSTLERPQQLRPNHKPKPNVVTVQDRPSMQGGSGNGNRKHNNQNGGGDAQAFPPRSCGESIVENHNHGQQSARIVGGDKTKFGEHPWQAMIWEPEKRVFCGGTVLSDVWIISAAHCFDKAFTGHINWRRVWVRLGKFNQLKQEEDEFNSQIDSIYQHPDFNGATFDSDLTLVKLKKPVRFSPTIQPICLGDPQFVTRLFQRVDNQPGRKGPYGIVTGWGKLAENGSPPKILQEIELPIVTHSSCKRGDGYKVTENMFCAGYDEDQVGDACQGDSGGPFMIQDKGTWSIIGVVSFGTGCARGGQYGFYTKVNNFHQWIHNQIKAHS